MDHGISKAQFLETMRSERAHWEALLSKVGETRMTEPGVAGDWSVKDIVAHVAACERGLVSMLEAASRGESLGFPILDHPDVDYSNALIFARNRDRSLEDVLAESRQIFQQLLSLAQALPEEMLLDPQRTEWFVQPRWGESRALCKCIADDSYEHYHQHAPGIRAWLDLGEE